MNRRFILETDSNSGETVVQVASANLWELAEHLSDRRVLAICAYAKGGFRVRFPRLSTQEVSRILDDFAACPRTAAPAQASSTPMAAETYLG